ncbi:unnamed protein product [Dovyalis caffra]|uniref:Uncharacterized protein n=1 Tax=Dovyalis caffra TaxID=77055 RepID=A0AAV1RX82_9ROSI|nr:unnamed protein product [Dovyalis caffra]
MAMSKIGLLFDDERTHVLIPNIRIYPLHQTFIGKAASLSIMELLVLTDSIKIQVRSEYNFS